MEEPHGHGRVGRRRYRQRGTTRCVFWPPVVLAGLVFSLEPYLGPSLTSRKEETLDTNWLFFVPSGHHIACAVAAKLRLSSKPEDNQIEFSLCWDMPKVQVRIL